MAVGAKNGLISALGWDVLVLSVPASYIYDFLKSNI